MSILLEKVNGKQASAHQGKPVLAPAQIGAGRIVRYLVRVGQHVEKYAPLVEVEAHDGQRYSIDAPRAGMVEALPIVEGGTFPAGAAVAYLIADATESPTVAKKDKSLSLPFVAGKSQQRAPQSAREPVQVERRSTMMDIAAVEELQIEELEIAPPAKAKAKQKRERTKHHTTHLTGSQIKRVKKLSQRLDLDDVVPGCGEAELMRAAVEMLLSLPEPALLAVIEQNREREKAGKYGTGYQRGPGK